MSAKDYKSYWSVWPHNGPNERRVIEEHTKLTAEEQQAESEYWVQARLIAILTDLRAQAKDAPLENPS